MIFRSGAVGNMAYGEFTSRTKNNEGYYIVSVVEHKRADEVRKNCILLKAKFLENRRKRISVPF